MLRGLYKIALLMAVAAAVCGCKREAGGTGAKTIKGTPTVGPPDGKAIERAERSKLLTQLYDIGNAPTGGTVFVDAWQETWSKQNSGLMIHDLLPSSLDQPARLGQTVSITFACFKPGTNHIYYQCGKVDALKFILGIKEQPIGLSMGIHGMHVHGTRRIYLPPELAFGKDGNPAREIGGNQPLIYEVELLSLTGVPVTFALDDFPKNEPLGPPAPQDLPPPPPQKDLPVPPARALPPPQVGPN